MNSQLATKLASMQPLFEKRNSQELVWDKECSFARQQLEKNDFTMKVATNNAKSLQSAILNVAAIGISLNPASAQAYLVPRDGMICLDISYRGLVRLAVETGGILWAKSELVYNDDIFTYAGPAEMPTHSADVFADNRVPTAESIKGVYTIAKTPDGDILVDVMTKAELLIIRDTSMAFTRAKEGKRGPWENFFGEMCKKSAIKRAAKQWPSAHYQNKIRLDSAIDVINQHEGIVIESIKAADTLTHSPDQKQQFDAAITAGDDMALYCMQQTFGPLVSTSLYNSFPAGEVTKFKRVVDDMSHRGLKAFNSTADTLHEYIQAGDDSGAAEIIAELADHEKSMIIDSLSGEEIQYIRKMGAA